MSTITASLSVSKHRRPLLARLFHRSPSRRELERRVDFLSGEVLDFLHKLDDPAAFRHDAAA